ncbi:MAG: hypothetical protein VX778_03240, partial [Candidatus Thermoplasmatota archaeon]|nr:hypothetical protein [Candidatus Thermoplasmatota archaeon]
MSEESDVFAQVGIGAIIVFIGMLLAVTSSAYVMLNQLERLAQSTEKTVYVATNEAHTQIIFVGGWIDDDFDDYLFMVEYQSLGKEVITSEVGFVLWCEHNDVINRRYGYLGDDLLSAPDRTTIWPVGDDPEDGIPETLESGNRYFIIADGGRGGGNAGTGGNICGPEFIHQNGISAYYSIYLPNGGHMTQELKITTYGVG